MNTPLLAPSRPTRLALLLALATAVTGCGSSPKMMEVELTSTPSGARVFISRRGESTYQGKVGFIKGNVKATPFTEEPQLVGTTPVTYSSPLKEMTTDATVLGVGGRVIKTFKEGVFRFERPGFEPVEQFIRFEKGREVMRVTLPVLMNDDPNGSSTANSSPSLPIS